MQGCIYARRTWDLGKTVGLWANDENDVLRALSKLNVEQKGAKR